MSYEYKAKMMLGAIQDAKDDYINATSEEDKEEYRFEIRQLENLKVLYEEAAKADEYEAKAKAFDKTMEYLETELKELNDKISGFPYVDQPIENTIGHFEHVLEEMMFNESGESE